MGESGAVTVRKVSATSLRGRQKTSRKAAKGGKIVLIENRRRESKYSVDKEWLDALLRERESILATLEVLADRELTTSLLKLAESLDADLNARPLHSMEEVFGQP